MASFAYKVKAELCRTGVQRTCCARAEAYGALLFGHSFSAREIRLITGNEAFAARLPKLFQKAFSVSFDHAPERKADGGKLTLQITDPEKIARIISQFGYEPRQLLALHVNFGILEDDCCRNAFLRGAFLAGGSVTDPEKRYHLELSTCHTQASREVSALLTEMGFVPHSVMRGGNSVIYFKQSEHIEDFLTGIGAPVCAMEIMTAKVDKEIRNSANRATNCDMANMDKTLAAAAEQCRAIAGLRDAGRLKDAPEKLRQAAEIRLAHPEASLSELTQYFVPPVSRSGANHRIRKLMEMAEEVTK